MSSVFVDEGDNDDNGDVGNDDDWWWCWLLTTKVMLTMMTMMTTKKRKGGACKSSHEKAAAQNHAWKLVTIDLKYRQHHHHCDHYYHSDDHHCQGIMIIIAYLVIWSFLKPFNRILKLKSKNLDFDEKVITQSSHSLGLLQMQKYPKLELFVFLFLALFFSCLDWGSFRHALSRLIGRHP